MTRLARLEMHCNKVAHVNVQLSHLGELQVVDLSTNNLEALPASLAQCHTLRILVRHCYLLCYPSVFWFLMPTTTQDLNNNQLKSLKGIGNLTQLTQVRVE